MEEVGKAFEKYIDEIGEESRELRKDLEQEKIENKEKILQKDYL